MCNGKENVFRILMLSFTFFFKQKRFCLKKVIKYIDSNIIDFKKNLCPMYNIWENLRTRCVCTLLKYYLTLLCLYWLQIVYSLETDLTDVWFGCFKLISTVSGMHWAHYTQETAKAFVNNATRIIRWAFIH